MGWRSKSINKNIGPYGRFFEDVFFYAWNENWQRMLPIFRVSIGMD